METEKLKISYTQNRVVQAICDHLAGREKNQSETKLHRMLRHLANDGFDLKRSEVIAAFRALADAGCGRYVEGRHGWPSRFVWEVRSLDVSAAARGVQILEREPKSNGVSSEEDVELVEHSFVLRPDVVIALELPPDLTRSEASRLAAFVQALPYEQAANEDLRPL